MELSKFHIKSIKKATKLIRHLKRFPADISALKTLAKIDTFIIAVSLKKLPEEYGAPTVQLLELNKTSAYSI